MKPNKQRIFSSQPNKPGSASKISLSISNANIRPPPNAVPKHPGNRQSDFHLNDIIKNLKTKKTSAPFKMIQFEESTHSRRNTETAHETYNPYKFVSALSYTEVTSLQNEEEPKEATFPVRRTLSEVMKSDEMCNNTTDTLKTKKESVDLYYGIIPSKYWCKRCREEVISRVKMNLPTLSV